MKYDIDKIMADATAKKWVYLCMAENRENPTQWFKEKNDFWKQNSTHLETFGFNFNGNITHALDNALIDKIEDMEGCLLVVRVGTNEQPASTTDVELAHRVMEQALEGLTGVRVIISHHALDVKKISLPQLRKVQSEVLMASEPDWHGSPIIDDLEV